MAKNQVLQVLIGCNRQLLLIKFMRGFKTLLNCEHVTKELNRCYSFYFSLLRTRGQHLNYNIFWKSLTWTCDKKKLGLVSKPYFMRKMFILYEQCFSCYIITTQVFLSECYFYFLRYRAICVF